MEEMGLETQKSRKQGSDSTLVAGANVGFAAAEGETQKNEEHFADEFAGANWTFAGANYPRARTRISAGAACIREFGLEECIAVRGRGSPFRGRGSPICPEMCILHILTPKCMILTSK